MITSITLQGFKSFAERTRLEFGPGVTAVVGPNGSGKSNVVEALRWVSHQARARELRAARATELIFHGSASRAPGAADLSLSQQTSPQLVQRPLASFGLAPLGLAEVQLELRTLTGDRLHLARRIYRDGSAEQDIMGQRSRARDVQNALRGTGLGSGGLAVIGQGEVSSVVQAEGHTLLAYVQEAAGLSRGVLARHDTAAQLALAEGQLAQVRLLENELEGRARRLQLAATAAARSRALTLRALHLQDALSRAKYLTALEELLALRARGEQLGTESRQLSAEVQRAAAALEQAREYARQAREAQRAHAQTLELYRAAVRAQTQAEETRLHLERDLEAAAAGEHPHLQPSAQAVPDLERLQTLLEAAGREHSEQTRSARELESSLWRLREQASLHAERQAASAAQRGTLQAEADRLAAQLLEGQAALETARAERQILAQRLGRLAEAHTDARSRQAGLLAREQGGLATAQQLSAEVPPLRREQQRLEASLNGYARYGEGPRVALQSGHPGILGSVADLLSVPAAHETAVGAALGRRLEQVVVERADDAREIIEVLKRRGGRATFLPLDLLRPRPRRDAGLLREAGVLGNLSDLCPSQPPIVGQTLLSDTLLMDSLQAATALARRHAQRPRLVTVDGELLEPGGALTGGKASGSGASVLGDQRRLAELERELEGLSARQTALGTDLARLQGELQTARQVETTAYTALEQARAQVAETELVLAGLEAGRASVDRQHQSLRSQLQASSFTSVDGPAVTAALSVHDSASVEEQLHAARAAAELAAGQERALNAELAAGRELASAWEAHHRARAAQQERQARQGLLTQRLGALQEPLAAAQAETLRQHSALGTFSAQELPAAEAARDAQALTYSALIARQNRVSAALEEVRLAQARREGGLEGLPDGNLPAGTPREWQPELGACRSEHDALGTVNPAAAQELMAEQERLGQLEQERLDVEQAADELRGHLSELDRAEQAATELALARVGRAFASYSGELLGGLGELEPERGPDERLCGLKLSVQPSGKRTRNLNLLSTGERTMAGLAFLFALAHAPEDRELAASGLPLAVLDEVDAPLDEANIRRFTRFLTLFAARGSQFVLVTHQKATMEVANALWGVTTDASGASRVLSIRQPEDSQAVP